MILLVGQCLGGRHHDGVAGVYAHGVDVLHGADLDHIARGVPHDLEFDLLPPGDGPFDQDLSHPGHMDAPVRDLPQRGFVVCDAAAGAAQRISRTDDHRITDGVCKIHGVLHRLHHIGSHAGLSQLLHGVLETLTVLRLADRLRGSPQKPDVVLL